MPEAPKSPRPLSEQRRRDRQARRGHIHLALVGDILLVLSAGVATLLVMRIAAGDLSRFSLC